jgi:hypothetical protein
LALAGLKTLQPLHVHIRADDIPSLSPGHASEFPRYAILFNGIQNSLLLVVLVLFHGVQSDNSDQFVTSKPFEPGVLLAYSFGD